MSDIPLSIAEAGAALRSGQLSSAELTTAVMARADELDPVLGVYLARFDEQAMDAARQADDELRKGFDRGPLHGIPLGIKDILATAEGPTTANSLVLDPAWGERGDAPVVARLKEAGAVLTGKLTTMEFAIGTADFAKPFPIPRNPWDVRTWPGGSSSGTGSGVAAGLILGGIGTDTGGSIRIPAAYCGISGLMPTFGRVPKSGCVPLGYSLDHIGPMARSVADCAFILQAIAGHDPSDPDSAELSVPSFTDFADPAGARPLAGIRIGVDREHLQSADQACEPAFDGALDVLRDLGATLTEVSLPYYGELVAVDLVSMYSEALAYHLPDMTGRWPDYFEVTRNTVAQGALISGADYVQAQRVRRVAVRALGQLFQTVDLVAMPTITRGAPTYEELQDRRGPADQAFSSINTPYWDPAGNPVLALPMGFTAAGLPLSLQMAAGFFQEPLVLRVGEAYQRHTDWHRRVPPPVDGGFDPEEERTRVLSLRQLPELEPDQAEVLRVRLAAAGLEIPPEDLAAIQSSAQQLGALLAMLHAVPEARYEDPALVFRLPSQ